MNRDPATGSGWPRRIGTDALPDQKARNRIRTDHDTTLIVEAAAGTGKTTAVVSRVVELVSQGHARIREIAAITFSEKAGGELRLKIREGLEKRIRRLGQNPPATERRRLEEALAALEEASIGTIHSFCSTLLRERPVEAGVDPDFRVVTGGRERALFERVFRQFLEERLDDPGDGVGRVLRRTRNGRNSPVDILREAGRRVLKYRELDAPWTRRPWNRRKAVRDLVSRDEVVGNPMLPANDKAPESRPERILPCLTSLADLYERLPRPAGNAKPNWLVESMASANELAREIRARRDAGLEDPEWIEQQLATLKVARYRGRPLPEAPYAGAWRNGFRKRLGTFRAEANADLAAALREELRPLVARYEEAKEKAGVLDFDDLLLRSRGLLIANREVRIDLRSRFRQILVDEYQDTDPIQTDILFLLTAKEPEDGDWTRAVPVPGKLCLVGDPKQSIYGFRGADVRHYLRVKQHLLRNGAAEVQLLSNFRSAPEICDFVNAVMAPVFSQPVEGARQVRYLPLHSGRVSVSQGPALAGIPVPKAQYLGDLRREEPEAVAGFVEWLLRERTVPGTGGKPRPVEPSDICLLFRRFRSWGRLVPHPYAESLRKRGIPFSLAAVESYVGSAEMNVLRAALTAIEFPRDEVSVYATLRGPLFSIPDENLFRFRQTHGPLHPGRRFAGGRSDPAGFGEIREALRFLLRLHEVRNVRPIAATLQDLLARNRSETVFAFWRSPDQVLSNVRRLADQARTFEARGGLSFRALVEELTDEAERPEIATAHGMDEDLSGVRIMTMHGAKGLEFPVVILCDAACPPHAPATRLVDRKRRLHACDLGNGIRPWELLEAKTEVEAAERVELDRLLYVAATRACDLLAAPVPNLRYPFQSLIGPISKGLARHLVEPTGGRRAPAAFEPARDAPRWKILQAGTDRKARRAGMAAEARFLCRRVNSLADGSRPSRQVWTAKQLAELRPGTETPEVDIELVPRDPGRPGGASFGSAVHRVLERVGLDPEHPDLPQEAQRAAVEEELSAELAPAVARTARRALQHELLVRARGAAQVFSELPLLHREEIPVEQVAGASSNEEPGQPPGPRAEIASALDPDPLADDETGAEAQGVGRLGKAPGSALVEGVADLVFREEPRGAWTVVDFKTDRLEPGDAASAETEAAYRRQVWLYARALEEATGLPVRPVLLFI